MQKQTVLILGLPNATSRAWMGAFQQRGFEATLTDSPSDVTHAWHEHTPMLTIVDSSIPAPESIRLCRDLRAVSSAPILLILASANDLNEAYRAGATECLVQPASPAVILLKALAWFIRNGHLGAAASHTWAATGSFFQSGLTSMTF